MRQVNNEAPTIKIIYYTHPLCPISWEMQRSWDRVIQDFGHISKFHLCMGSVSDDTIAALGYEPKRNARDMTCLAVKAASLQSPVASNLYLTYLRQAFMVEGGDPSCLNTLIDTARQVSRCYPGVLNFQRFFEQFNSGPSRQALSDDRKKIQINQITIIPTLTLTFLGKGVKLSGSCSYDRIADAFGQFSGSVYMPSIHSNISGEALKSRS